MFRAALFSLALMGGAHASDSVAPVRYHHGGVEVIMHNSMKAVVLSQGDNPIGKPKTFQCKSSAGCAVVMTASMRDTGTYGQTSPCLLLDGMAAAPGCGQGFGSWGQVAIYEQAKVTPGEHSISLVLNDSKGGDTLLGFAAEYRIYERKVKGAD
jgi:hypothetical protein